MDYIYLDYAATTPADDIAVKSATPYFGEIFYNPSSAHALGRTAEKAVERARSNCARSIGCAPDDIIFTSGGTEAVNLAMLGVDFGQKKHAVVSAIEHDSALACAKELQNRGIEVDYAKPNRLGVIEPEELKKLMRNDTALVCVMSVNNQTGVIQPVKELANVAHGYGAKFFTDAVQAVNALDINVKDSGADMLAVSAHKFYSLKGAGFLYAKNVRLKPLAVGGGQERGMRAGTVNVPAVVAMGEAICKAVAERNAYRAHVASVAKAFLRELKAGAPIRTASKIDDICTVIFDGISGERLAVALSLEGVCCSVGSACAAGSAVTPPSLVAMGLNAKNALRFSFGRNTTKEQAERAAQIVNEVAAKLVK